VVMRSELRFQTVNILGILGACFITECWLMEQHFLALCSWFLEWVLSIFHVHVSVWALFLFIVHRNPIGLQFPAGAEFMSYYYLKDPQLCKEHKAHWGWISCPSMVLPLDLPFSLTFCAMLYFRIFRWRIVHSPQFLLGRALWEFANACYPTRRDTSSEGCSQVHKISKEWKLLLGDHNFTQCHETRRKFRSEFGQINYSMYRKEGN
jgi:hypothetical protein